MRVSKENKHTVNWDIDLTWQSKVYLYDETTGGKGADEAGLHKIIFGCKSNVNWLQDHMRAFGSK